MQKSNQAPGRDLASGEPSVSMPSLAQPLHKTDASDKGAQTVQQAESKPTSAEPVIQDGNSRNTLSEHHGSESISGSSKETEEQSASEMQQSTSETSLAESIAGKADRHTNGVGASSSGHQTGQSRPNPTKTSPVSNDQQVLIKEAFQELKGRAKMMNDLLEDCTRMANAHSKKVVSRNAGSLGPVLLLHGKRRQKNCLRHHIGITAMLEISSLHKTVFTQGRHQAKF